jgi:hypothetical protein
MVGDFEFLGLPAAPTIANFDGLVPPLLHCWRGRAVFDRVAMASFYGGAMHGAPTAFYLFFDSFGHSNRKLPRPAFQIARMPL